jgi:hypothetical protein
MCEAAGIPRNTPYSGRRTFISSLIDAQVNIKTIQNYVGHKDSRTTYRNYCFDRSDKETRVEQLNNARLSLSVNDIANHISAEEPADLADFVPGCTQNPEKKRA